MRDEKIYFSAQAGEGIKRTCDAIEGLKKLKQKYKEQPGMDVDISYDLEVIRSNLRDLVQLTEENGGGNRTSEEEETGEGRIQRTATDLILEYKAALRVHYRGSVPEKFIRGRISGLDTALTFVGISEKEINEIDEKVREEVADERAKKTSSSP